MITRQGKSSAVIMDLEKYVAVQKAFEEFSRPDIAASLLAASDEFRQGQGVAAEGVFCQKDLSM